MNDKLEIAVVGAGVMGANHVRVVGEHAETSVVAVVDVDTDRAAELARPHGAAVSSDLDTLVCDAAIVAAPTEMHVKLATPLLERGIPLLVEKPLGATLAEVDELLSAAQVGAVPLMCGFVERFNPAVRTALQLLDEPPIHLVGIRHSPPTPRIRTSVVHDLLIHDIDLALMLGAGSPIAAVTGSSWASPAGIVEIADCTIAFEDDRLATLSSSRMGQRKLRSMSAITESQLIEIDLLRHDVTVYRHRAHSQVEDGPTYRAETVIEIPFVRHHGEPLALQLDHFVALVRGEIDPEVERGSIRAAHEVAERLGSVRIPTAEVPVAPA